MDDNDCEDGIKCNFKYPGGQLLTPKETQKLRKVKVILLLTCNSLRLVFPPQEMRKTQESQGLSTPTWPAPTTGSSCAEQRVEGDVTSHSSEAM